MHGDRPLRDRVDRHWYDRPHCGFLILGFVGQASDQSSVTPGLAVQAGQRPDENTLPSRCVGMCRSPWLAVRHKGDSPTRLLVCLINT